VGLEQAVLPILEKGALTAGEFRTPDDFVSPFRINVPEGWTVDSINSLQVKLLPPGADNRWVYVQRVPGTIADFLKPYEDGGSTITDPISTEVAGTEATYVQVTTEDQNTALLSVDWTHNWYFVDVDNTRLLIAIEASNAGFDEFSAEAVAVIESIEWVSAG